MDKFYNKTIHKLETVINDLEIETDSSIERIELVIELIIKCLSDVKEYVSKRGFKNDEEEIHFFKYQKPAILAKLIYYNAIYKIETKMPFGGQDAVKNYLNNELLRLKKFFDNHLDFYKYYRTNSTYLDHKYFLRGKYDIKLSLDTYYFETDHTFSTSHDYKVAKIIANDLLQVYIEGQICDPSIDNKTIASYKLNWTGSKTSLIELIYALNEQAVFDNGNTDIKIITKAFEYAFNIDLGDFYHTYLELRSRKVNRTKFLDALKESLLRKMEDQDEK